VQGILVEAVGPRPVVAAAGAIFVGLALWLRFGSDRLATVDEEGLTSADVGQETDPAGHAASLHSSSQAMPSEQLEERGHHRQA